jgi:hypothetical protein
MTGQENNVRILVGSLCMLAGSLLFLPVCFPRLRLKWNNGMMPGGTTFAGIGMFITGLGAALFSSGYSPLSRYILFFVIFALAGWVLGAIGFTRDKRLNAGALNARSDSTENVERVFPPRLTALIMVIFLTDFLYLRAEDAWTNYWLLTDAQQGMAIVTHKLWSGHDQVGYDYTVSNVNYTGKSARNRKDPKYGNVQSGQQSIVYYSFSHPSISLLYKPDTVIPGFPVIIIVLVLEFFAIVTIINPKSGWAFNLTGRKNDNG